MYNYKNSVKSDISDELINVYAFRPIAGVVVRTLYETPFTPNQLTIVSVLVGLAAAVLYLQGDSKSIFVAGLLVTLKDILDSADGQLARAKQLFSRIGRFLDSIGDFVVDVSIFGAIGFVLYHQTVNMWMPIFALLGLCGITFRVSYHVFYQVNYLHLQDQYQNNRVLETIRDEDIHKGGLELMLQRIFQSIYGWQDAIILKTDRWCRHETIGKSFDQDDLRKWFSHKSSLRLSGFLGFGTELFLLTVCSICNCLGVYLFLNLFLMNGILLVNIWYRRYMVYPKLK